MTCASRSASGTTASCARRWASAPPLARTLPSRRTRIATTTNRARRRRRGKNGGGPKVRPTRVRSKVRSKVRSETRPTWPSVRPIAADRASAPPPSAGRRPGRDQSPRTHRLAAAIRRLETAADAAAEAYARVTPPARSTDFDRLRLRPPPSRPLKAAWTRCSRGRVRAELGERVARGGALGAAAVRCRGRRGSRRLRAPRRSVARGGRRAAYHAGLRRTWHARGAAFTRGRCGWRGRSGGAGAKRGPKVRSSTSKVAETRRALSDGARRPLRARRPRTGRRRG